MATEQVYQLLDGKHYQNGKEYTRGDKIRTAMPLQAMFPNKFVLVQADDVLPQPVTPPPQRIDEDEEERSEPTHEQASSQAPAPPKAHFDTTDARDVTTDFPGAMENGWTVMKGKKDYFILDSMEGNSLTEQTFSSKAKVNEFLASFAG